jgi:hypothetical protein
MKSILVACKQSDPNSYTAALIYGLHAFLYATAARASVAGGGRKTKDTILDSIKTMFLLSVNQQALEHDIDVLQTSLHSKGRTLQPLICGFGKDLQSMESEFIIRFDSYKYKFESLDSALENLLKMYYVFSLKFPTSSTHAYNFLSAKYLGCENDLSAKVQTLINLMG